MIMASILNHVTSLHMRLRFQVNEYFNLINRMREGVLVFVKAPLSEIKFCNKATEKIFDIQSEKQESITVGDLNQPRFLRSKLFKENIVQDSQSTPRKSRRASLIFNQEEM